MNEDFNPALFYTSDKLKALWEKAKQAGLRKDEVFKLIDSVDKGEPWTIRNKKITKAQQLPVSNVLSTIRDTRHGAFSVRGFVGEFKAETRDAEPAASTLQNYVSYIWNKGGYDEEISTFLSDGLTFGTGILLVSHKGGAATTQDARFDIADNLMLVNVSPSSLYVEPGAFNEDLANYFFIKQAATIEYLSTIPLFEQGLRDNYNKIKGVLMTTDSGDARLTSDTSNTQNIDSANSDFLTYIGKRIMSDGSYQWDLVYMFANVIIATITDIQPNKCPLVIWREQVDKASFWGQSSFKKNLATALNYNDLQSIILTHAKKQQNPISFVKTGTGINIADFNKNKDVPGATFPYSGNMPVNQAVQYLSLPELSQSLNQTAMMLKNDIYENTGTTGAYTGADTGSIQTAGGIDQVIQRGSLKDVKTIENFEAGLRDVYQIIFEFAKTQQNAARFSFQDQDAVSQNYGSFQPMELAQYLPDISLNVNILNHTSANKDVQMQTIEQLWQQSVQYGAAQPIAEPTIMTADEYLSGLKDKDFNKLCSQMMSRRQKEREIDLSQIVTHIIQMYLTIVGQGVTPQEALVTIAQEYAQDAGVLKQLTVANLIQQQQSAAGGIQGSNGQTTT